MNEKYIFGLVVVATTLFATISIVSDVLVGSSGTSATSLTYNTAVCVYKNGELVGPCTHNLVTTLGKEHLEKCLGTGACGTPTDFVDMTIGNCTGGVAAGDTSLCNGDDYTTCDLGQASGTYVDAGDGAWNVTYTWTANSACSNIPVNATGLYNGTVGGTGILFAENNFTSVTLQGNDQINVTWSIWVT